ncbi:mitochondrial 37S ribosomal protein mS43 [Lodderomyces beijingensis]|uniref:Manganese/iron superoxide dismutase C-terminal domain-containing protein n=1 Tax=Lodderomyces beijingensis TaxID=1775926 RepID=A0ABP0ZLM5_9ASCO
MLRPATYTFKRSLGTYSLPVNKTLEILKATNANFEGLFSHDALNQLWFKQGASITSNLNQHLTQAHEFKDKELTLAELIHATSNKPDLVHVQKNAAKLHNLIAFFENLRPLTGPHDISKPGPESLLSTPSDKFTNVPTDENLVDWISHSFGSMQEFRNLVINTAHAIKGDGTVWLVAESTVSQTHLNRSSAVSSSPTYHNLALIATYNHGVVDDSERSGQISRMKNLFDEGDVTREGEGKDEGEGNGEEEGKQSAKKTPPPPPPVDLKLGTAEQAELDHAYVNKKLIPALAIDASPRNYLIDYGVYGKQQYLDNCWECIDWDVVSRRLPPRTKQAFIV